MVLPIKPWLTWSQTARDLHLLMPGNLLTLPETQACHPFDQGWGLIELKGCWRTVGIENSGQNHRGKKNIPFVGESSFFPIEMAESIPIPVTLPPFCGQLGPKYV